MTEQHHRGRIDVREVRGIEARSRWRLHSMYSSRQLRSTVAGVRQRLSRRRLLAAVAPLIVAAGSWMVVPSYADYTNPAGRSVGVSGGSGRCIWDGSSYRCPSSSYLAYGYFTMNGRNGSPDINGYCLDLEKEHYTGDVLDENGSPDAHVQYIIATHYPAADGYAHEMNNRADEAAAVQIAVWAFTNDALGGHGPQGSWPASDTIAGGTVNVIERARQIRDAANANAAHWHAAQGAPTMTMAVEGSPANAGSPVTMRAVLKNGAGDAFTGGKVKFTVSGGTIVGGGTSATVDVNGSGHAAIQVTGTGGNVTVHGTLEGADTLGAAILVPHRTADQRIGIPRRTPRSPEAQGVAAFTIPKTTPTVATQTSAQTANPGDTIHDTVVVSGSNGDTVTATAALYGPFAAAPGAESCTGTAAWTGTIAIHGDGTYQSGTFTVHTPGYYTYVETLPGDSTHNAVTTPCGSASETTVVNAPTSPKVTTQTSKQTANVGDSIHDTVVVTDSHDDTTTATANLYGPFTALPTADSCTGTPAWTGSVAVHGDGNYDTAAFKVTKPGYYTYQETLPANETHTAVTTPCGVTSETTIVKSTPVVSTTVSAQAVTVGGSIHDTVVVTGSNGETAKATVNLYGPFTSAPTAASCTGTPAWTGSVAVKGDGSYVTGAFTVTEAGYFTYQETLPADTFHEAVTTPCGVVVETTLVSTPPQGGGVQAITVGPPLQSVTTPSTGAADGMLRTTIVAICLMTSGLIVVTGVRRRTDELL